jgi:hypothetical protein
VAVDFLVAVQPLGQSIMAVAEQFASSGQELQDTSLQLIQEICNELLY